MMTYRQQLNFITATLVLELSLKGLSFSRTARDQMMSGARVKNLAVLQSPYKEYIIN